MVKASFKPSSKKIKKRIEEVEKVKTLIQTLETVKMISLYVLRNEGWGETRLKRFNDKWNEYVSDVSHGLFSLQDIYQVLEEETGLTIDMLKMPRPEGVDYDNL